MRPLPAPLSWRLAAALALTLAACGGPKLTADGNITIDGQARTARSCAFSGSGAEVVMTLTLDDGARLGIPIHGGTLTLEREGKKLALSECDKQSASGSGSSSSYHGQIAFACKGEGATLDMALTVACGTAGPSNEKK